MRTKMAGAASYRPSRTTSLSSTAAEPRQEQRYKSNDVHYRTLTPPRSLGQFEADVSAIRSSLWLLDHTDYSPDDFDKPFFDQARRSSDFYPFLSFFDIEIDRFPIYHDNPYTAAMFYAAFGAFASDCDTVEQDWTLLDIESSPSLKRSLQRKGTSQPKAFLQKSVRGWPDFSLKIFSTGGIELPNPSRVHVLNQNCEENEASFRRHPWRTLASTMCRKQKGSYRHLASRKHKHWLERDIDDYAYTPAARDRRDAPRYTCHLRVQKKPVVENKELLRRLLALLRNNSFVAKEGYAARFIIGTFVGQHVSQQAEQVNIGSEIYRFEARSHPDQQAHKALVFERSKVRGWNQRQRKRCTKLAYPDDVLLDAVYSHDFQVLVFSGPWPVLLPPSLADCDEFPPLQSMQDSSLLKRDKSRVDRAPTDTVPTTNSSTAPTDSAQTGPTSSTAVTQWLPRRVGGPGAPSLLGTAAPQSPCHDGQRRKRHWIRLEDLEKTGNDTV